MSTNPNVSHSSLELSAVCTHFHSNIFHRPCTDPAQVRPSRPFQKVSPRLSTDLRTVDIFHKWLLLPKFDFDLPASPCGHQIFGTNGFSRLALVGTIHAIQDQHDALLNLLKASRAKQAFNSFRNISWVCPRFESGSPNGSSGSP
jgi:hypothetical protein